MKKLDQLEAFVSAANEGSFSLAAKKLNLTTSAVSQKITALEEHYKLTLLNRTSQGITLTEHGEQLYGYAKHLFSEIREMENLLEAAHSEPIGELHVSCPIGFYLQSHLNAFVKTYPKIRLKVDINERIPDLSYEKLDAVFGVSHEAVMFYSQEIVQRKIARSRYIYCASPNYLANHSPIEHPNDLVHHHIIMHAARPMSQMHEFNEGAIQVEVKPSFEINHTQAMLSAALEDVGIIRLHKYMVEKELKDKSLIEVLPEFLTPELSISLFYRYAKNMKPALRCFFDFMVERLQEDPAFK